MAKATYLDELLRAYELEWIYRLDKTGSIYKNKNPNKWIAVAAAHKRKAIRRRRRSVGKSNKYGVRLTASSMALALREMNMLAAVRRSIRASREQK